MTGHDFPVPMRGVIETVVTTPGPDGRWNAAALGLRAGDPVTARTWGKTRTRRNFDREGRGVVQFTDDPVVFVEAALGVLESDAAVLPEAAAWARVTVDRVDAGTDAGTEWVEWAIEPAAVGVERRAVPAINRGFNAVIEATVAASRLDVDAYDRAELAARLDHLEAVVARCGGDRERAAMERVRDLAPG